MLCGEGKVRLLQRIATRENIQGRGKARQMGLRIGEGFWRKQLVIKDNVQITVGIFPS